MINILNAPKPYAIYSLSEKAITIEFGNVINEDTWNKINELNRVITNDPFSGFIVTVSAYTTLTVFFDPITVSQSTVLQGIDNFEKVSSYLINCLDKKIQGATAENRLIEIPVCYGGRFGPDLKYIADYNNLSVDNAVVFHSSAEYKVYMIGFIPGFAYLGGMTEKIAAPRKAEPRKAVPAGSIGIAGNQTGIYPLQTPGGWQLIGQTPLKLFDVNRETPSLLKAGDTIKFVPISESDFEAHHSNL